MLKNYRRYLTRYDSAIVEVALQFGVEAGGEDFESLPRWMLFALPAGGAAVDSLLGQRDGQDLYLVQGSELLEWLRPELSENVSADIAESTIRRWTIAGVPLQASLRQAMDTIRTETAEAVCVFERSRTTGKQILHGVGTRESIEKFTLERL